MWFNKGDQNSLESGLKRPRGNELCRRLHPNDSRNPFSFTVAPQGVMVWGRGTASAVDRVLSYTDRLRRSPPLFFMPPAPYPARCTRCLPHGGRLWDMGKGKNKQKRRTENGSPFLLVRLACVSEVAGRYRAKARKRAGLE